MTIGRCTVLWRTDETWPDAVMCVARTGDLDTLRALLDEVMHLLDRHDAQQERLIALQQERITLQDRLIDVLAASGPDQAEQASSGQQIGPDDETPAEVPEADDPATAR